MVKLKVFLAVSDNKKNEGEEGYLTGLEVSLEKQRVLMLLADIICILEIGKNAEVCIEIELVDEEKN